MTDPRTAAHVLEQIAAFLELHGENRFKTRAYQQAARALQSLDTDDLAPLLRSGELQTVPGLGPATVSVLRDLIETGESRYLEQLRATTPEGLLEMLRVPGLGTGKIHRLHEELGIQTLAELEAAARDGRLAKLPRFGEKTAEKILRGIEFMKRSEALALYHRAAQEGARLLATVRAHPGVLNAAIAGSLRRRCEVIADVDIVAACAEEPERVAASMGRMPGVREVRELGASGGGIGITFVDGVRLDLYCVAPARFALALWIATGNAAHLATVRERLADRGFFLESDDPTAALVRDPYRAPVDVPDEETLYRMAGMQFIPPELREGRGEVEAAERNEIPALLTDADVQGVLHCHSDWSDGKATIMEMAEAARARGWKYLGISDHSQAAFYAGGLTPDRLAAQHEEIDRTNETLAPTGFRVLKGIEADILADGALDYDAATLDTLDFVIGSVHSRFRMDEATMTARVLAALDDPHLTVLGHPTGRLLLSREPYALDVEAVLEKAARKGVAVELNADPHRLDLDWRLLRHAKELGVTIEIGPDAHSPTGLDNVPFGVGIARKGWLTREDVLNARSADDVLRFARHD